MESSKEGNRRLKTPTRWWDFANWNTDCPYLTFINVLLPGKHSKSLSAFALMSLRPGHDPFSLNDQRIENYVHLVGLVFLLWDHILTFSMELKYLWKPTRSIPTCLFFFNRYFPLLSNIPITVSLFDSALSPSSCSAFHVFREISLLLTEVNVSVLLTLRIYAIYDCNKRVFSVMASIGAILAGLALFALFFGSSSSSTTAVSLTPLGCHTNLDFLPHAAQEAAAWEALFVYDCLLFAMIILKGYKNKSTTENIPLLQMVLRDGAIYFAVMALANLANIFTFYFTGPYTRGSLSTFSSATSVTMISRLTLNLRANAKAQEESRSRSDNMPLSTLQFGQHRSTGYEQSVLSHIHDHQVNDRLLGRESHQGTIPGSKTVNLMDEEHGTGFSP